MYIYIYAYLCTYVYMLILVQLFQEHQIFCDKPEVSTVWSLIKFWYQSANRNDCRAPPAGYNRSHLSLVNHCTLFFPLGRYRGCFLEIIYYCVHKCNRFPSSACLYSKVSAYDASCRYFICPSISSGLASGVFTRNKALSVVVQICEIRYHGKMNLEELYMRQKHRSCCPGLQNMCIWIHYFLQSFIADKWSRYKVDRLYLHWREYVNCCTQVQANDN